MIDRRAESVTIPPPGVTPDKQSVGTLSRRAAALARLETAAGDRRGVVAR
jgi:hypothetical protein